MIKDVVCGKDISGNKDSIQMDYKGTAYFFCTPICRDQFEKSPDKFSQNNRQPNSIQA